MTTHPNAPVLRTWTRAELAAVLGRDHAYLLDGVYSRRGEAGGPATLAFDFDDPGDLGVFIVLVARSLPANVEAIIFAAALDTGLPGHPDGDHSGLRGAWWRGFALDEPTGEQWADQINDCALCMADDSEHNVPDCTTHERAPWERPYALVP